MNQLALSNNLNIITAEINSYKQVAGQAIFEIGKRLKHVKENDLSHGQFSNWLKDIDFDIYQASRFIKVFDELSDSKLRSGANIGFKALYEIATLPAADRETPHIIPSTGEVKSVDEMTNKELREVKQALKAAEAHAAEAEASKTAAELRAKQADATRQQAIQQHAEQQEKLLSQIDELKQKKEPSEEEQAKLRQLQSENNSLTQAIRQMKEDFADKYSALEKNQYDLRKMKESLSKTRAYVEVDMATALNHFIAVSNQKEAIEAAELFWSNINETLDRMRHKWSAAMNIELEVLEDGGRQTGRTRSTVIIEHDS